jgi:hypothetical protein
MARDRAFGMTSPSGESRGGTPEGERALQGARRSRKSCGGYGSASFGVPLSFSSFLTVVAQSADRDGAGTHRRRHLTKIGAESELSCRLNNTSDADRIARTRSLVIPGRA